MNLLVDQGNTICKTAVCCASELLHVWSTSICSPELIDEICDHYPGIQRVIYSSVASPDHRLINHLSQHFPQLCILDADTPLPIKVNYDRSVIGSDRLAAVVGAWSLCPNSELLVIDAGTAITYERVSSRGVFLGGNISPGLYVRLKAMQNYTHRLPQIDNIEISGELGTNTVSAMTSGVTLGIAYEIDGYIRNLKLHYPDAQVYMTGGDADKLRTLLNYDVTIIPDLVLLGLDFILTHTLR